ncbi:hypothetical protein EVAR_19817_1 [Eumeta japonica]|uniref:Uncharacterized protein n=1 Tax=Eumeta variegata TaxID=151549 RepID=A0A4C1UQR0_EUMVA|nr:hypothetical protein EVAR_19817_1 [Eumeta japonica]
MPEWKGRVPLTRSHCERITESSLLSARRRFVTVRSDFGRSAGEIDGRPERVASGSGRLRRARASVTLKRIVVIAFYASSSPSPLAASPRQIKSCSIVVGHDCERLSTMAALSAFEQTSKPVAGVLMSYSRGCDAVLSLMAETAPSTHAPRTPPDSCSDGYHSDSDHAPPSPPQAQPLDDRSKLVSRYAGLYRRAADDALPALAALEPLQHSPAAQVQDRVLRCRGDYVVICRAIKCERVHARTRVLRARAWEWM